MWRRARFDGLAVVASLLLCACAAQPTAHRAGAVDAISRSAASPQAPAQAAASDVVIAAMSFIDRPYQAGGQSVQTGFDCSGFTRHVFGQTLGIDLPRSAQEQAQASALQAVPSRDELQPGDLVFFNTQQRAFSHVGIYLGDGRFIHAPRTGAQIRIERMSGAYWSGRYSGARRAAATEIDR